MKALLIASVVFVNGHGQIDMDHYRHNPKSPDHFYSQNCCNRFDCRLALPGEVEEVANGYRVRIKGPNKYSGDIDEIVSYNDNYRLRDIPNKFINPKKKEYHVCTPIGEAGEISLRCLYVPHSGGLT